MMDEIVTKDKKKKDGKYKMAHKESWRHNRT